MLTAFKLQVGSTPSSNAYAGCIALTVSGYVILISHSGQPSHSPNQHVQLVQIRMVYLTFWYVPKPIHADV